MIDNSKDKRHETENRQDMENIELTADNNSEISNQNSKSRKKSKTVKISPVAFASFDDQQAEDLSETQQDEGSESSVNMDIVLDVPLEVTVQIGRARKKVKEIIEFNSGSIIELDKQAGDPVDVIVNGQLIARGDVVVIDDNFGVRITEILAKL